MGSEWVVAIVALAAGGALGWFAARSRTAAAAARAEELRSQLATSRQDLDARSRALADAQTARTAAETRVQEIERHLAEQKALLETARTQLTDAFKSLAADALAQNNTGFLVLAEQKFQALKDGAASDLEARKSAVERLVKPIEETLLSYQRETQELEKRRLQEMSSLGTQLAAMADTQGSLQQETAKLVNALRSPQVRGRWGEIALRRTAELAGMSAHCDFSEQETVTTEDGRIRPDMIVRLPAGREVVVDSKVPLDGFLKSLEAKTELDRTAALDLHASQLRQHVSALAAKQYWEQFQRAPEFVVLFIPNDSFLAAAAEREPSLIEEALERKVVIATPTTFIALLRAIAYGWRQEQVAESAQKVSDLGRELYKRISTFLEHLESVGGGLKKAVRAYNEAVASVQSRLLPLAEKFEALGASSQKELPELEAITEQPRIAAQKELPGVEPEAPHPLTAGAGE